MPTTGDFAAGRRSSSRTRRSPARPSPSSPRTTTRPAFRRTRSGHRSGPTDGSKVVEIDSTIPSPPAVVGDYTPFAEKIMTANGGQPPDLRRDRRLGLGHAAALQEADRAQLQGHRPGLRPLRPALRGEHQGSRHRDPGRALRGGGEVPAVQTMITDLKAYDPNFSHEPAGRRRGTGPPTSSSRRSRRPGPTCHERRCTTPSTAGSPTTYNGGGGSPVQWPLGHQQIQVGLGFVQANGTVFNVLVPGQRPAPRRQPGLQEALEVPD